jgi:hypothetical protein
MRVTYELPPYQKSADTRNYDIHQENRKGTKQARWSAEGVPIVSHLAADGIDDRKQRDRGADRATEEKEQSENTSNNLPSTHPSNDPKMSDTRRRRGRCGQAAGASEAVRAATVTPERVRCSAWLGHVREKFISARSKDE